jgi:hypothetical protein
LPSIAASLLLVFLIRDAGGDGARRWADARGRGAAPHFVAAAVEGLATVAALAASLVGNRRRPAPDPERSTAGTQIQDG